MPKQKHIPKECVISRPSLTAEQRTMLQHYAEKYMWSLSQTCRYAIHLLMDKPERMAQLNGEPSNDERLVKISNIYLDLEAYDWLQKITAASEPPSSDGYILRKAIMALDYGG